MKKKLLAFVTAAAVAFGMTGAFSAADISAPVAEVSAAEPVYKSGDFYYSILDDGTASIIDYTGSYAYVDIPSEVGDYEVTVIDEDAFYNCDSLISVNIPEGVTAIDNYAFQFCNSLTEIIIPDSITSIGEGVFYHCTSLIDINIPDSVTSIGDFAFSGCTSLTDITIPDSVTSIGWCAFTDCSSLTSVKISNNVIEIDNYAFDRCTSLTEINVDKNNQYYVSIGGVLFNKKATKLIIYPEGKVGDYIIPDSVTEIDDSIFYNCTLLTSVTIPDSVISIDYGAFNGCTSLIEINVVEENPYFTSIDGVLFNKKVTQIFFYPNVKIGSYVIPNSVTAIGSYAFNGCNLLTSITIPDSVTLIGHKVFSGCNSLTDITIPDSVTYIGEWAFEECTSLTNITLPNSVTEIGYGAFEYCTSLTNVTIPDSITYIDNFTFYDCTSLTSVTIPNSVTSIGNFAFEDCTSLMSVTIPDSVTEIGYSAFSDCPDLTIYGIKDSYAEIYAVEKGIFFADISEMPTEPIKPTQIGDVNIDNAVNIVDLVMLCKHVVGVTGARLIGIALANSDCNGDGNTKSDADDAIKLAQFIVKKIPSLPNAA